MRVEPCFSEQSFRQNSNGVYLSGEVPYLVFEVATETEALQAVRSASATRLEGMPRKSIDMEERINETTFKVTVRYEASSSSGNDDYNNYDPNESSYAFDTGGGTQHITQSLGTVNWAPANAPNLNGAIGYDGESVNGVDITIPVMNFSETHYFSPRFVSTAYKKTVAALTGCINNASFKGYHSGEVLFLGAAGSRRGNSGEDWWEISFKFAVSVNRNNLQVGNLTVPQKLGWDYMWVRYADNLDGSQSSLIKIPVAAYVERVYPFGNFGALGIGR